LWEVIADTGAGEITHDRTGDVTAPLVPYDREVPLAADQTRRQQLAAWITSADNDYFARSYVNRMWGYLMGRGLIEPLDDIRAGNPPSNPELLDLLTKQFIESGFNVQQLVKSICKSRVYQLSLETNKWNEDDQWNFSHANPKRLPAEVLYDSVYAVTGSQMNIPGVPAGTRAAALPDVGVELSDNFLANLGRPVRESACECERSGDLQLGPVMALMNGPTVSDAISQGGNGIEQLVNQQPDDRLVASELFLRILGRPARDAEIEVAIGLQAELQQQHDALLAELETYRQQIAGVIAEKENKRAQLMAAAQQAYDGYAAEIKPREDAAEADRVAKIAAAKQAVADREAALVESLPEWEQAAANSQSGWRPLTAVELSSTTCSTLAQESDLSVFASGANSGKGFYLFTAETDLTGITGIKLELLADDRLPSRGPGRPPNGNFVLTEFSLEAWLKDQPEGLRKVALQNAQVDFAQDGFSAAATIDGDKTSSANGWATHPKTGENRTATFEFKEPLNLSGVGMLAFQLDQMYDGLDHQIGRFRISVTTSPVPLTVGLSEAILAIIATPAESRTDEQRAALLAHVQGLDADLKAKRDALVEAEKPRPEDPKLVELRTRLAEASKPLPKDPQLARYERAVELSRVQLEKSRLTTAQDLAWALINSPAFLFNR
jgi:hypothetical protein